MCKTLNDSCIIFRKQYAICHKIPRNNSIMSLHNTLTSFSPLASDPLWAVWKFRWMKIQLIYRLLYHPHNPKQEWFSISEERQKPMINWTIENLNQMLLKYLYRVWCLNLGLYLPYPRAGARRGRLRILLLNPLTSSSSTYPRVLQFTFFPIKRFVQLVCVLL